MWREILLVYYLQIATTFKGRAYNFTFFELSKRLKIVASNFQNCMTFQSLYKSFFICQRHKMNVQLQNFSTSLFKFFAVELLTQSNFIQEHPEAPEILQFCRHKIQMRVCMPSEPVKSRK